jgi:hypothetical protein
VRASVRGMRAGAGVVLLSTVLLACGGSSKREGAAPATSGGTGTGGSGAVGGASSGKGGKGGSSAMGGSGATGDTAGESGQIIDAGGTGATGGAVGVTGGAQGGGAKGGSTSEGGASTDPGAGAHGNAGGTGGTGGTAGQAGMPTSPITSCTDDFPFIGTWSGNVLDFYFDPIQPLELDVFREGSDVRGILTYGGGDLAPPPTDPDAPWPPGYWDTTDAKGFGLGYAPAPMPGFPYTVVRGAGCDTAFRFSIASTEAWRDWCGLQTPLYTDGFGWACILRGDGASGTSDTCTTQANGVELATYPAWKCAACGMFEGLGVCQCDEAGCYPLSEPTHVFDLTYLGGDSNVLTGKDPSCPDCTVRLTRSLVK